MTGDFPLPPRDEALAPFWDWAARGALRLPRRIADGGFDWYPSGVPVEWVALPGGAALYSWAGVTRPLHPGYAGIAPYVPALVEPDGAPGVRLVTRLVDVTGPLAIGMRLAVRFVDLGAGGAPTGVIGPLFAPVP